MKELLINTNDLKSNIEEIKKRIPNDSYTIIGVVKSNGYGLDIIKYTNFLIQNGINFFAVSSFEEALTLRKSNIQNDLLILSPSTNEKDIELLIDNNVILTIDSILAAKLANKIAKQKNITIKAHIKIDTGLSRFGFDYSNIDTIINVINNCTNLDFIGIYSHFSKSLASDSGYTNLQFSRFMKVISKLEENNICFKMKHICNSSAFLKYSEMHLDAARIGSAFIGITGISNNSFKKIGQFHTNIKRIKIIPKHSIIGYGNTYITKKETKIAILPIGYFDGIGLSISDQRFSFLSKLKRVFISIKKLFKNDSIWLNINNTNYEVIGQIGMCDTIIDITNSNLKENDEVCFNIRPIYIDSSIERRYI